MQRNAVVPHAVIARHAAGNERGTVGLTHRIGDVETLKAEAVGSDPIKVGRGKHSIPVATQMIGAVLIGHDEEKIVRWHAGCPLSCSWRGTVVRACQNFHRMEYVSRDLMTGCALA